MNILTLIKNESKEQKKLVRNVMVMSAVDACSQMIMLALFHIVISSTVNSKKLLIAQFIVAFIVYIIISNSSKRRTVILIARMVTNIRTRIIKKTRGLELRTYEKINKSYIYNSITIDIANIIQLTDVLFWMINSGMVCIICLVYVASFSFVAFVLTIICIVSASLTYMVVQKKIKTRVIEAREQEIYLFRDVEHLVTGFKELTINRQKNDDFFHSSCRQNINNVKDLRIKVGYATAYGIILTQLFWFGVIFCIAFILPLSGYISKEFLPAIFSIILFMPFVEMLQDMPFIILANISVDRIYNIDKELDRLDRENKWLKVQESNQSNIMNFNKITYNQLRFNYTDPNGRAEFSIGPIDLTINAGEIIFITGGNGSGKSTLLKLITGLYCPLSGNIEINDRQAGIVEIRCLFSPIFTDPYLFDRLYGLKYVDMKKVNELLVQMKLIEKTQYIEDRFTELSLSTGQKKRLAMIAALMEDKPIYIFDEWAAEQDSYFRSYFYHILLPFLKEKSKTIIAVTHDDQYFSTADRIVEIDHGKFISYEK